MADGSTQSGSPPDYVWLVEAVSGGASASTSPGKPTCRWTPLSRRDSARVESAFARDSQAVVPVESGLYDVHVSKRTLKSVYWEEPARRVLRGLWFHGAVGAELVPYEEKDSEALERALQRLRAGKERAPLLIPVQNSLFDVRFEEKAEEPQVNSGFSSLFGAIDWSEKDDMSKKKAYTVVQESVDRAGSPPIPVWRGSSAVSQEEESDGDEDNLPRRVEFLVFVVHGIGQYHKSRLDSTWQFRQEVDKVRRNAMKRMRDRMDKNLPMPGRLEFLPLQWFESIHIDVGIGNRLKDVTLTSVPLLRNFANYAIADFMVYQDDEWKGRLHSELMQKMSKFYDIFKKRNPDFTGKVAVMGHSLGSVIMFDILHKMLPQERRQGEGDISTTNVPMTCPVPRCLFALGSPLGMFLSIRSAKLGGAQEIFRGLDVKGPPSSRRWGWRLFNVFHPDDPIAYRLEPLLNADYANKAPRLIHYQGGLRFHNQVRDYFFGGVSGALDATAESETVLRVPATDALAADDPLCNVSAEDVDKHEAERKMDQVLSGKSDDQKERAIDQGPSLNCIHLHRVDYSLQTSALETINELLSAIKSHGKYWESEDLATFIVDQLLGAIDAQT